MDCECLIHPFQNDPGTSQRQRVMDDLLSGAAKIDARTLADLLDYFVQMSRHINFYDLRLNVHDWQSFFKNSTPFTLASVIRFPLQNTESGLTLYKCIFDRRPSPAGVQLLVFSIYYRFISNINNWHLTLNNSGLPIAATLEGLIKNKLQEPVQQFIKFTNAGVKKYGISRIDFLKLSGNPVWGLDTTSINATDTSFSAGTPSSNQQLINLYNDLTSLVTVFSDSIKSLSSAAEKNMEQSFVPLKEELQKKNAPHLALLFAFLNMFRQLQNDLNQYTRKHLDYFYKNILQFQAETSVPDKANIVFEIQKVLKNFLLKKGLRVKDGKDDNSRDIIFSLEDEIVVTQTTIADKKTLYINNQQAHALTYVEGVYMAPVADMADGVVIPFADDPKNFFSLGSHNSKYIDPETKLVKPHPNARMGFILASPVLLLQAGSTRTIDITLPCELNRSICADIATTLSSGSKNCCSEGSAMTTAETTGYPDFYKSAKFYDAVSKMLNDDFWYINEDMIKEAQKKGMSSKLADEIRKQFLIEIKDKLCYCPVEKRNFEKTATLDDYNNAMSLLTPPEKLIFDDVFKPRKALNFLLSGEKEWIEPSSVDMLEIIPPPPVPTGLPVIPFTLHIQLTLNPDKAAVTFYDKTVLLEDFGVTHPLIKIELDDKIKLTGINLASLTDPAGQATDCCSQEENCCLLIDETEGDISLYHFFRNVLIAEKVASNEKMNIITVNVCGLKNFIVQNDDGLMDVNGPVMAFGARPKIDSNFFIGSEEIFLKNWSEVWIDVNWKNLPAKLDEYYIGYQNQHWDAATSTWINDGLITKTNFQVLFSFLEDGIWYPNPGDTPCLLDAGKLYNRLFPDPPLNYGMCFGAGKPNFPDTYSHQYHLVRNNFSGIPAKPIENNSYQGIKRLNATTRCCFLKFTLKCQDFQHEKYPFILARQMAALGKLPELITGAVYFNIDPVTGYQVLNLPDVFNDIQNSFAISDKTNTGVSDIQSEAFSGHTATTKVTNISNTLNADITAAHIPPPNTTYNTLNDAVTGLQTILKKLNTEVKNFANSGAVIPNEPYTPDISAISLDYIATAGWEDIDLTHLYPFKNTYKHEEFELEPTLFPTFCDEGTLFLGLQSLVPGDNLNILFQLAEATSDSESDPEEVYWYYLDSNAWKPLRTGFEVLDDGTKNLTSSGIIKFALPANMTNNNTVMPAGMHWIKAAIPQNSGSVSETTAILTQAIQAVFTNDDANDKLRLSNPLKAGSISKLDEADASVKSVSQPYDSFGGLVPEIQQQFYVRVSETLRHKGRAIQAFDYERLVLQAFPQLFKVKCINHSFALNAHEYKNDFPYAPGYVLLAVIPDLNQLKAGNSFEPKVPVSIIEDIDTYIRRRTSPFVRFRAMNPRYEKIDFCLRLRLVKGKDENYYKEKVKADISAFLAPWSVGEFSKLTFGQCIYRSDIILFLETRDYVDYIGDLQMARDGIQPSPDIPKVCPATPRSILIAGNIEVCISPADCETWGNYYACDDQIPLLPCNTKVEKIMDYCKKTDQ